MRSGASFWQKLRKDKAGLAGLSIVLVFFLTAAGVWSGVLGLDWSAASSCSRYAARGTLGGIVLLKIVDIGDT